VNSAICKGKKVELRYIYNNNNNNNNKLTYIVPQAASVALCVTDRAGVQRRLQPKPMLTDHGLQPYSLYIALVCHLMVSTPVIMHISGLLLIYRLQRDERLSHICTYDAQQVHYSNKKGKKLTQYKLQITRKINISIKSLHFQCRVFSSSLNEYSITTDYYLQHYIILRLLDFSKHFRADSALCSMNSKC